MTSIISHNLKIYRLLSVFGYPFFWQPILFLFFTQTKHLTATQALSVVSLYSLGVVVLEVPGGAVADHISRKFSATIGYLLKGAGFALLTMFASFPALVVSMLIISLGESLVSGSLESLMYDSIKQSGQHSPKYFKKIFASTRTILHFSLAIFIAIGGWIGQYNLTLPILLSCVGYLISAILSSNFVEPNTDNIQKSYLQHIIDAGQTIFSKSGWRVGIIQLLAADFFILGLISAMFWLTTPILHNLEISVLFIGILTASMRVLKSFGSFLVSKFDDPNDLRTMLITSAAMSISFIIASQASSVVIILLTLFFLYLVQAFFQANNIQLLNDLVADVDRTTLNSFQSLFTRLYEFSVIPLIGVFIDAGNNSLALLLVGGLLAIGFVILLTNRSRLTVPSAISHS